MAVLRRPRHRGTSGFDPDDPVASIERGTAGGNAAGFVEAWRDLLARIRRTQSEPFMSRLASALRAWIENARRETENAKAYARTGALPSFDEMLTIRTVSIGMYPTFHLLELAEGLELPDDFHDDATVVELKRLASRLVGYGNDIGELAKDLHNGWPNLVVAYRYERDVPLATAFDAVVGLHNAEVEAFDVAAAALRSWGPDVDIMVREWLRAVRHSVLGFTLWESRAKRYQKWRAAAGGRRLVAPVMVTAPAVDSATFGA